MNTATTAARISAPAHVPAAPDYPTLRFDLTLADGTVMRSVAIRGLGGMAGESTLTRALRMHAAGRPAYLHEPKPGHLAVYPAFCAAEDGPEVAVPMAGLTWVVARSEMALAA